jgi:hypothetical protein
MNEIEFQERVRAAIGESSYPAHLPSTVEKRLGQAQPKSTSMLIPMVAGLLALLIVVTLLAPRLLGDRLVGKNTGPGCASVGQAVSGDLSVAGLSNVECLVTPLGQTARDNSGSVTLLAGYSDDVRTVLIFHMEPFKRAPDVAVSDDHGPLGPAGSFGYSGGDTIFDLYTDGTGPHLGLDGLAHLTIVLEGQYSFEVALKVQRSKSIPVPEQVQLGSWKVNLQFAKVTPNAILVRALVTGPTSETIANHPQDVIRLLDSSGTEIDLGPGSYGPVSANQILFNVSWVRPPGARSFVLRFDGDGATKTVPFTLPAANG